jgi:hypothetical protein
MEQWFAFRALNSQTLYGFGTDQQADKFTDHLNQRRKTDVYRADSSGRRNSCVR